MINLETVSTEELFDEIDRRTRATLIVIERPAEKGGGHELKIHFSQTATVTLGLAETAAMICRQKIHEDFQASEQGE